MEIHDQLRANCDKLLEAYHTNLQDVRKLQDTLIRDVLPSVTDELNLTPGATEWAEEWLSDTATIFRIARRNQYTKSFTLEAVRKNLVWRLDNLWPPPDPIPMSNVHCIPPNIALDPFGRPIVIVQTTPLEVDLHIVKQGVLQFFETVRWNLHQMAKVVDPRQDIPLQYMVILDLKHLTFQRTFREGLDIMTWAVREVIPRYPGMLAGVFMLNYSWTHSGIWNVVKRILPTVALSRVFFPSIQEVIGYFTPASLPQEYGGNLPSFLNTSQPEEPAIPSRILPEPEEAPSEPSLPSVAASSLSSWTRIPSTSLLNPFFGYPATTSPSGRQVPALHHGRRRKRDLLRTLMRLWWIRWHSQIVLVVCLSVAFILFKARRTLRILRWFNRLKGARP